MTLNRPVAHLLPCVDAVTVRAKKAEISFIGFPVSESVIPYAYPAFISKFLGRVYMVYVKNSVVGFAAFNALTTKACDQLKLSFPVSRVFMRCVPMLVPVRLVAFARTEPVVTGCATFFAGAFFAPARGEIARLTAELPSAIFNAVGVRLKWLRAVSAFDFNLRACAHTMLQIKVCRHIITKYFDIAVKRIEQAVAQGQLFTPEPIKQEQVGLFPTDTKHTETSQGSRETGQPEIT